MTSIIDFIMPPLPFVLFLLLSTSLFHASFVSGALPDVIGGYTILIQSRLGQIRPSKRFVGYEGNKKPWCFKFEGFVLLSCNFAINSAERLEYPAESLLQYRIGGHVSVVCPIINKQLECHVKPGNPEFFIDAIKFQFRKLFDRSTDIYFMNAYSRIQISIKDKHAHLCFVKDISEIDKKTKTIAVLNMLAMFPYNNEDEVARVKIAIYNKLENYLVAIVVLGDHGKLEFYSRLNDEGDFMFSQKPKVNQITSLTRISPFDQGTCVIIKLVDLITASFDQYGKRIARFKTTSDIYHDKDDKRYLNVPVATRTLHENEECPYNSKYKTKSSCDGTREKVKQNLKVVVKPKILKRPLSKASSSSSDNIGDIGASKKNAGALPFTLNLIQQPQAPQKSSASLASRARGSKKLHAEALSAGWDTQGLSADSLVLSNVDIKTLKNSFLALNIEGKSIFYLSFVTGDSFGFCVSLEKKMIFYGYYCMDFTYYPIRQEIKRISENHTYKISNLLNNDSANTFESFSVLRRSNPIFITPKFWPDNSNSFIEIRFKKGSVYHHVSDNAISFYCNSIEVVQFSSFLQFIDSTHNIFKTYRFLKTTTIIDPHSLTAVLSCGASKEGFKCYIFDREGRKNGSSVKLRPATHVPTSHKCKTNFNFFSQWSTLDKDHLGNLNQV